MVARTYEEKVVVIAGGASGIGEQLVRLLVSFGSQVIVLDRDAEKGSALAKDLPSVDFNHIELGEADRVKRSVRHIMKKYGRIDYFFTTAGVFLGGEIRDTPIEDWNRISISNLSPVWNCTSIVYAAMQKQGYGHIINTASAAGLFPVPAMSIYGATKAAIVALTLGLRNEARTLGIKASVVCPTIVTTPLYDTALYAGVDRRKVLHILKTRKGLQTPDVTARRILKKVARNKAVIHTASSTYGAWLLFRVSTQLYGKAASRFFAIYRKQLRRSNQD